MNETNYSSFILTRPQWEKFLLFTRFVRKSLEQYSSEQVFSFLFTKYAETKKIYLLNIIIFFLNWLKLPQKQSTFVEFEKKVRLIMRVLKDLSTPLVIDDIDQCSFLFLPNKERNQPASNRKDQLIITMPAVVHKFVIDDYNSLKT